MEDEENKGMLICLYLYERNILLIIMIIMIMLMIMMLLMTMIYEFVSHQHLPPPVSSDCHEVSNGSTLIRRDKCWRSTMKRQIERDLWVFCQALTKGVGKKWVCIGSASLVASTKNIPALRTNMTLENHNFKQEILLPMVWFSSVMLVFRGCTTSITKIYRWYTQILWNLCWYWIDC